MRPKRITPLAIALASSFFCVAGVAANPEAITKNSDVELVFEQRENGERKGEISQARNTGDMLISPVVNTFNNLDGSSTVVTIRYVGYASFAVAKNAKNANDDPVGPGHVFAVQLLKGKKGVTIETAEKNVTKLVVYQKSPQIIYEDGDVSVAIRNKKP